MKTVINNNQQKSIMKRILIYMFIVTLLSLNITAVNDQMIRYEFEEGAGSIVFDSSGHDRNAFNTFPIYTTDSKFGIYALSFNAVSTQLLTSQGNALPSDISISFWYKCADDGRKKMLYTIYDNDRTHFALGYDIDGGDDFTFYFQDQTLTNRYYHFDTDNKCSKTVFKNYVLTYSNSTKTARFYIDGVLTDTVSTATNPVYYDGETKYLKIGATKTNTDFMDGSIDEFRIFNSVLNQSQVIQLQSNILPTGINLPPTQNGGDDNETQVNGLSPTNIINYTLPFNDSMFYENFNLDVLLNRQASCEVYINNNLYNTYENYIAFTETDIIAPYGLNNYFLYCYYVSNNTLYYEISDKTYFYINQSNSTINFYVAGTDFDVNTKSLYIVTPCIKDIVGIGDFTKDVIKNINKDVPYYFQKLDNGFASFTLNSGTHEFCIINGQVQYSQNYLTTNYNINTVNGVLDLGSFDLPSNVTSSYTLNIDTFEIYNKINPKAWGQTWAGVIGGLILLLLGVMVLVAGVYSGNGKIVVAGAILCLSALGVSLVGFLGVLL